MSLQFGVAATSSTNRPLRVRMRPDLVARKHTYQHRPYWVVKEPVGLKYFRFHEPEYAVLRMLDGQTSLEEIKERFERQFAPQRASFSELQQLIGSFHRGGLVISDMPGQGDQLWTRGKEQKRKKRLAALANVFALRWKGIDPDRLLNWLYPRVAWFFTKTAVYACCLLCLAALILIATQFSVFRSRLPAFNEFFGHANWLYLGLTLAVVKVLHEFGHGLSCKHFGGECHEIGFMLLVFTPALYCNVSDSWMLRSKWQRAAIGAAGIYVEVVIAAAATFVWWFSEPGPLNHLALNAMFLCSVSTIMFNGNPLLRFDGYYILADLVEIPNLRQKATEVLRRFVFRWVLGIELPDDPFLPTRNRFLMGLYTVAAVAYRWIVVVGILLFLNKVLEPYGLKILGQLLALTGVFGLVVAPLIQVVKFFRVPGRMHEVKRRRLFMWLAGTAVVVLMIALIPLPHRVQCSLTIEPADATTVYVETPGRLDRILVTANQQVAENDELVRLENIDLDLEIARLERSRAELTQQIENLEVELLNGKQTGLLIAETQERLVSTDRLLEKANGRREKLSICAPISGTVFVVPAEMARPADDDRVQLPQPVGTPLDSHNLGLSLAKARPICRIGNPDQLVAVLVVDQSDIDFVDSGQDVRIVLDAYPGRTIRGKIDSVSRRKMTHAPAALAAQAGGGIETRPDAAGGQQPLNASYQADVTFDQEDKQLQSGLRGTAKINVGYDTLGSRAIRYLSRTFRFSL